MPLTQSQMMSRNPVSKIERRLPEGCELPAQFEALLAVEPLVSIEWNGFEPYSLKQSASKEAVPFVRLSDGGLVAFWFRENSTPIIHIGGHGELDVVAVDFDHFLKAINTKSTGLGDFDDADPPIRITTIKGRPRRKEIDTLNRELKHWFERHTSLLKPLDTKQSEQLRRDVYAIAESMIRDGKSKVYNLDSNWWSMDFQIDRTSKGIAIRYLDFGKWYKLPAKYQLGALVTELLTLVKHKNRKNYEISVCDGIVSIDRDQELVLVPPDYEDE